MSSNDKPRLDVLRGAKVVYLILGFLVAVVCLGVVALFYGGSVQASEGPSGMSFRVEGYQDISLMDALTEAWKRDSTTTRTELIGWGQKHEIVDGSDLHQLEAALQKWHPDSWFELLQLAERMKSERKAEVVNVRIGFAAEGTIKPGTLYFQSGDKRFVSYMLHDCKIAIGYSSSVQEQVGDGVNLTGADVQIPFEDLVDLCYRARFGPDSELDKSSKRYKAIEAWVKHKGIIRGKVFLL